MKLVHIHMHFPWALLSLNLGQVFNPLNESGVARLCLLGTAPRQMQKSSSFINTKLNLASHISINRLENIFVCGGGQEKGREVEGAGLEVLERPRSGDLFAYENTNIYPPNRSQTHVLPLSQVFKTQIVKNQTGVYVSALRSTKMGMRKGKKSKQ